MDTPGNVKLLLPPRQSRGFSYFNKYEVIIQITDFNGNTEFKTFTFDVTNVEDVPIANADTATLTETLAANSGMTVLTVLPADGVLKNNTNDGADNNASDALKVVSGYGAGDSSTPVTIPSGTTGAVLRGTCGDLTLKADGSYDYVANAAYDGLRAGASATDQFTCTVNGKAAQAASSTLTFTINGASDQTVLGAITARAVDESVDARAQAISLTGTLSFSDRDIGDTLAGSTTTATYATSSGVTVPSSVTDALTASTALTFRGGRHLERQRPHARLYLRAGGARSRLPRAGRDDHHHLRGESG